MSIAETMQTMVLEEPARPLRLRRVPVNPAG
jgi:hypothetical protein